MCSELTSRLALWLCDTQYFVKHFEFYCDVGAGVLVMQVCLCCWCACVVGVGVLVLQVYVCL